MILKCSGLDRPVWAAASPMAGACRVAIVLMTGARLMAGHPEQHHVFGSVAVGETVKHTFLVNNEGRKTIAVLSASSACSCLLVEAKPDRVPAGARGELRIVFKAEKLGAYDARIALETDDPETPVRIFHMRGRVLSSREEIEASRARQQAARAALAALALTAAEAETRLRDGSGALAVDVRSWRAFSCCRIPGSRNYDLPTLPARRHLAGRAVVLVGYGWDEPELGRVAGQMKEAGFGDVRVLAGGMRGWLQAGFGTVGGGGVAAMQAALVPASALRPENGLDGWMVVGSGAVDPGFVSDVEAGGGLVVRAAAAREMSAAVAGGCREHAGVRSVLVLTEDGAGYEQIEAALRGRIVPPVFFLEGGARALDGRLALTTVAQSRTTRHLVSRASDTLVAGGGGIVRRSRGCGGCP